MKAILIDPREMDVKEIDVPLEGGNYKALAQAIGCDLITVATYLPNGDCVFVDDEGLLFSPEHFFSIDGFPQPLAGCGLVMGSNDEGDSIAPTSTVEEITNAVLWPSITKAVEDFNQQTEEARMIAELNNRISEMFGGKFFHIVSAPTLEVKDGKVVTK